MSYLNNTAIIVAQPLQCISHTRIFLCKCSICGIILMIWTAMLVRKWISGWYSRPPNDLAVWDMLSFIMLNSHLLYCLTSIITAGFCQILQYSYQVNWEVNTENSNCDPPIDFRWPVLECFQFSICSDIRSLFASYFEYPCDYIKHRANLSMCPCHFTGLGKKSEQI